MKYLRFNIKTFLVLPLVWGLMVSTSMGGEKKGSDGDGSVSNLAKSTVQETGFFDGNRVYTDMENNGIIVSAFSGHSGMEWPFNSGNYSNYASGVWIGGKANGIIGVSAGEYQGEYVAGPWDSNPFAATARIYKIQRSQVNALIAGQLDPTTVPDINEWPGADGAPYVDVDGDGNYDPSSGDYPDILGDQFVWYVANDGDQAAHTVFKSKPLGLETQVSIFGFDSPLALGDMMFVKYVIINKGKFDITDSYITLWSDPDLGDASDDFVACDTLLSLGYCYNDGPDASYGAGGGAIGYDFFQGPIVESVGDTALVSGKLIPGFKNLPMSSFVKFINTDDPNWSDPDDELEAYNLQKGVHKNGTPFINTETNGVVKFMYPDHPRDGQGTGDLWADIDDWPGDDRRMMLTSGPFTLALGDTQEVVFGILHALGADPFASIDLLKVNDEIAQFAYNNGFPLTPNPPSPIVDVTTFTSAIILEWGEGAESYDQKDVLDDSADPDTWTFEGYRVWQYQSPTGANPKLLGTYDLVNGVEGVLDNVYLPDRGEVVLTTTHRGSDSGVKRFQSISQDAYSGLPLIDNRAYYFGVTAYGYNANGVPKVKENTANVITIRPSIQLRATDFAALTTDIKVEHVGPSAGDATAAIINPVNVVNDSYTVNFNADGTWNLLNSAGDSLVVSHTNQTGDTDYPIVDGLQVKAIGPALVIDDWDYDGNRWMGGVNWGGAEFFGGLDMGFNFFGNDIPIGGADYFPILLDFQDSTDIVDNGFAGKGYMYRRDLGYAYAGIGEMPFTAWEMDWTDFYAGTFTKVRQLNVVFLEDSSAGNVNHIWDMGADTTNIIGSVAAAWGVIPPALGGREYTFLMSSDYDAETTADTYGEPADGERDGTFADALYALWPQGRSRLYGVDPFTMWILPNRVNTEADTYNFTTTFAPSTQAYDIDNVNLWPNPYFAFNPEEINPGSKIVTFTNLPEEATIRIFTLSGDLVSKIDHSGGTINTWNVANMFNIPVVSGMYIVHIDGGSDGTIIHKLGVVQAAERLNVF